MPQLDSVRDGIWSGIPMPWNEHEDLDRDALGRFVARCAANHSDGIYVAGTAGEFHAMGTDQFTDVAACFMEAVRRHPGLGHQVGCGAFSQREVLRRIAIAREHGARTVQVNLPGWVALTDDEVLSFYSVIAEEFPDVGIVVYDNAKSGRNVGAKLWPHLLRTVPSVIGGKMPYDTREVLEAVRAVRPDFKFFAVETTLEAMAPHGVNGVTAWVSYSFPRIIGDLWQAVADGEWATFNRCLEQTKVLHEIKEIVRPKGYRASSMDRLMGLASGFLEPVFARVLSPWSSVAREDIGWVRAQVAARLGEEFLYSQ